MFFFGTHSSVASFCLCLCFLFLCMILGKSVTFCNPGEWPPVGDFQWGLAAYSPLFTGAICSRGAPYVGCMGLSLVAGLTTVGTLVGRAGPQMAARPCLMLRLLPLWWAWPGPGKAGCRALGVLGWYQPDSRCGQVMACCARYPGGSGWCHPPGVSSTGSQHSWLQDPGSPRAGIGLLLGREVPGANEIEGGPQNGACQHQCPHGRTGAPKWLPLASLSPEGVPVPFCLPGRLSKISKWVDLGSFHITTSALDFRAWEILCESFKSVISVSYGPPALCVQALLAFKARCSGGLFSWYRTLGLGRAQCEAQTPRSLGRMPVIVIILPFGGCLPGSLGLAYTASPLLLPILLWFLLYIFSC